MKRTPPLPRPAARLIGTALLSLSVAAGAILGAGVVTAAPQPCVNPTGSGGCASSINAAIAAAPAGATITIRRGIYTENVAVTKTLTLRGEGDPTVRPAVAGPTVCSGSSLCPGASNVILVQADDVTIEGLTVDGHNPSLHSGVFAGGVELAARNGIITDWTTGSWRNLAVRNSTVQNIYLRGIQTTSNSPTPLSTVDFSGNTLRNVQGDVNASVAVLSNGSGAAGIMKDNVVDGAADALNSNWSLGIRFTGNRIRHSGSGIHTDNAGGTGGTTPDLIADNQVTDCTPGGFGLWSFVSYVAPVFQDNTVSNCDTALAAFGVQNPVTPSFRDNTVRGSGAAGTVGAYITTADIGFGPFNVQASLRGNSIRNFATGIRVEQTSGRTATATLDGNTLIGNSTGLDVDGATATFLNGCVRKGDVGLLQRNGGTLAAHQSRITHNTGFGAKNATTGTLDATNNWWGSPSGPAPAGHGDAISAGVNATPFLSSPAHAASCGDGEDD